jgi:hypothetical protein
MTAVQPLSHQQSLREDDDAVAQDSEQEGLAKTHGLERRLTNETITHPGDVRINVKGAFIVDVSPPMTPSGDELETEGYQHDPRDIRLPNHRAVVSHIAVDVRPSPGYLRRAECS